jgi:hypothetical protein
MVTTVDEVAVNGGDHVQVQVQVKVDVQVHVNVNDAISRSRRTTFSWQATGNRQRKARRSTLPGL